MAIQTPLATDARSLDRLRERAAADPQAAVKDAARQFEALFMQAVVKSMRDAVPKSGLDSSSSSELYTSMLDQQLAQSMAGRPGGLAEAIARQLAGVGSSLGGKDKARGSDDPVTTIRTGTGAISAAAGTNASGTRLPVALPGNSPLTPPTAGLSKTQAQFVERLWQPALAAQRDTGIPAAFIVGQAALETGWGRHEVRKPDGSPAFNLFGIKATGGWRGDSATATTTEFIDGKAQRLNESFRSYGSYEESMRDWVQLITRSPRYSAVVRDGQTVAGFAQELQRAGYATDPDYASKLTRTINSALQLKRTGPLADSERKAGATG